MFIKPVYATDQQWRNIWLTYPVAARKANNQRTVEAGMAKRPYLAQGSTPGETINVSMNDVDGRTVEITGISRPAAVRLSLEDEARIQTIERRITSGARHVADVMTPDERAWLESIGAEAKVSFALKDGREVKIDNPVDAGTFGALARKAKPMPTLADELVTNRDRTLIDEHTNSRAKNLLRHPGTKRFVLTEAAAIRIGEAIRAYPEMLVDHGWFARTPFPTCWIELPAPAFHSAIVPNYKSPTGDKEDDRVGYLFDGDHVYVGASVKGERSADFSPLVYHLHTPNTLQEQIDLVERMKVSRAQLDNFFWGATMAESLPQDTLRGLRAQHGFRIAVDERYRERISGYEWLGFSAGEVRNIIGILLMINQPSGVLHHTDVGHRKQMTIRGNRVLMSHSVVTLNLDRRSSPSRLLRKPVGSHGSPRWHEVMDHWCNDKIARTRGHSIDDPKTHGRGDHAHLWVKDDEKLVATCAICGGRRWRREMRNGRGDRAKGTISQLRVVSVNEDRVEEEYA
jgi:hypothetical protein